MLSQKYISNSCFIILLFLICAKSLNQLHSFLVLQGASKDSLSPHEQYAHWASPVGCVLKRHSPQRQNLVYSKARVMEHRNYHPKVPPVCSQRILGPTPGTDFSQLTTKNFYLTTKNFSGVLGVYLLDLVVQQLINIIRWHWITLEEWPHCATL